MPDCKKIGIKQPPVFMSIKPLKIIVGPDKTDRVSITQLIIMIKVARMHPKKGMRMQRKELESVTTSC